MSSEFHPENIFVGGPSDLGSDAIKAEIINSGCAVAFNAGVLALSGSLDGFVAIPKLVDAIEQSDAANIAQYSIVTAFTTIMSVLAAKNIVASGNRWVQARYNQKFNAITEQSGLDS